MPHADWRIGLRLRVFGQLASALEEGRTGGPRPLDVDTLRLRQAFLELIQPTGMGRFWGRVGRQEIVFGGSRTFATREPANVRRSFDAVRGGWGGGGHGAARHGGGVLGSRGAGESWPVRRCTGFDAIY